jgi:hypothetical protein
MQGLRMTETAQHKGLLVTSKREESISLRFRNNALALLARQISSLRERETPQIENLDPVGALRREYS